MDQNSKKKLISAMLLYCLAGDLDTRINYSGILISRVENYLTDEIVLKDPHHSYLVQILTIVDKVVESSLAVKSVSALTAEEMSAIKDQIVEKVFPIDPSWAAEESMKGLVPLGELAEIRMARTYFYTASDNYAVSKTSAAGLSEAIKNTDMALRIVVNICDYHNLTEFGANEWRENVDKATWREQDVR